MGALGSAPGGRSVLLLRTCRAELVPGRGSERREVRDIRRNLLPRKLPPAVVYILDVLGGEMLVEVIHQ
jgi:hypothetical protein